MGHAKNSFFNFLYFVTYDTFIIFIIDHVMKACETCLYSRDLVKVITNKFPYGINKVFTQYHHIEYKVYYLSI